MNCRFCGQPLVGTIRKLYCDTRCRLAWHRRNDQIAEALPEWQAVVEANGGTLTQDPHQPNILWVSHPDGSQVSVIAERL